MSESVFITGLGRRTSLLTASLSTLVLAVFFALILDQVRTAPLEPVTVERVFVPDRRPQGERAVQSAQQWLAAAPEDPELTTLLAKAYLLRVRETGDPGYYARADALLQRALLSRPDDVDALLGAGSLAISRHDFASARRWAEKAVALAPSLPAAHGVLIDALVELGRYEEAVEMAQRMVNLRPDLASYSRVSYLRELHGDISGAVDAMRLAVNAGPPDGEATAWSEVQLGHLLFTRGDLEGAARAYESATWRVDGYVYGLAGLAWVRAARGDLVGAASGYELAVQTMPLAEHVTALGDTYTRLGDSKRAQQQYELIGATQKLLAANGVRTDIDMALFNADHGLDLDWALEAARAEYAARPSVRVADTLAWVEYRRGELGSALEHSKEALRLGTRDPLMLYRAGVIAQANHELQRARDLLKASSELNPGYSILWSEDLRARLMELSTVQGGG